MEKRFFVITSYGRTGTNWFGSILNSHPDLCCSHARTYPPINKYGSDRDVNHLKISFENQPIFRNTSLQNWIESHASLKKARFYGNIHSYNAFELTQKIKEQSPPFQIKMINLLRHPITRIQSLFKHWITKSEKVEMMNDEYNNIFISNEQFHDLEANAILHKKEALTLEDKLFIYAVLVLYADYNDFSIPITHIPCERLFSDVDSLVFTIKQLTSLNLNIDDHYLDLIRSTEPKNVSNSRPQTAEAVYKEWVHWKQALVRDVFMTRNMFNLYAYFGYDLSFISHNVTNIHFPKTVLSDYTPRIGISPDSPFEKTSFKNIEGEKKTTASGLIQQEKDYKGFFIVFCNDKYYALSHMLGPVSFDDVHENIWKVWQKTKKCFVGDSLDEVKQLIDNSSHEYHHPIIDEIDRCVENGETLFNEGKADKASDIFSTMLGRVMKIKGTLLNNLAVINIHRGNLDLAELLLNCSINESSGDMEDAQNNLELVHDMKENKILELETHGSTT